MYQRRRTERIRDVRRELRMAARSLWRTPAFTVIAFITLALGIGATTAIYTVLDAVVLRPLPYRNADRLVSVLHPATVPGNGESKWGLSAAGYFYFKKENHTLEDLGGYQTSTITVTGSSSAENVRAGIVTYSIFTTLGGAPKQAASSPPTTTSPKRRSGRAEPRVLGARFGSDVAAIGKTSDQRRRLRDRRRRRAGAALPKPGPFASTADLAGFGVDVWLPRTSIPSRPFNSHPFVGIGRLKPGVTPPMRSRLRPLMARSPNCCRRPTARTSCRSTISDRSVPLRDAVLGPVVPRRFGFCSPPSLSCCSSPLPTSRISSWFASRRRRRESRFACRNGRRPCCTWRCIISRKPWALSGSASVAGVSLAAGRPARLAGGRAHERAAARGRRPHVAVRRRRRRHRARARRVLRCSPLLRRGVDVGALREGARGFSSSRRQRAARGGLVVGQFALSVMLFPPSGLVLRSFDPLRHVSPGSMPTNVLTFDVSLPYTSSRPTRRRSSSIADCRRIAAASGVPSVGAHDVPLEGYGTAARSCGARIRRITSAWNRRASRHRSPCRASSRSAGISVDGRAPDWSDVDGRSPAVVVTRALADRLWPGQSPIGKGIGSNGGKSKVGTVVGVVPELAEVARSAAHRGGVLRCDVAAGETRRTATSAT